MIENSTTWAGIAAMIAAVVTWAWNSFMPGHQMPAEVGTAFGGLVAAAVSQLVPDKPKPAEPPKAA